MAKLILGHSHWLDGIKEKRLTLNKFYVRVEDCVPMGSFGKWGRLLELKKWPGIRESQFPYLPKPKRDSRLEFYKLAKTEQQTQMSTLEMPF